MFVTRRERSSSNSSWTMTRFVYSEQWYNSYFEPVRTILFEETTVVQPGVWTRSVP
jgi:hypothetical protein